MNKKLMIWAGSIILALILLGGSLFVVKEGEYKVVLKFGEAVRVESSPGLYFKIPFIESVSPLPKYQMTYESNPTSILTKDKKPIIVDNYTVWRISNPQNFLKTVQTVGGFKIFMLARLGCTPCPDYRAPLHGAGKAPPHSRPRGSETRSGVGASEQREACSSWRGASSPRHADRIECDVGVGRPSSDGVGSCGSVR